MSSAGPWIGRRALTVLACAAVLCVSPVATRHLTAEPPPSTSLKLPDETRALWVLRTSLTSPDRITTLVRSARDHGFNTLFVQVRGRGDAYFLGGVEPRPADLQRQPASFDPLATVIESAHAAGLRVHAWINVNLVSSAADLPA